VEDPRVEFRTAEIATTTDGVTDITVQLVVDGQPVTVVGRGNGPLAAFVAGVRSQLVERLGAAADIDITDYSEHAASSGSEATAVAYVETQRSDGTLRWGVGSDNSILTASLRAVVSALNRPVEVDDEVA